MRCEGAALLLAGRDRDEPPGPVLARHVATCLRCQGEQARYQRLVRLLAQLRAEQAALRPGVLAQVVEAIGIAAEQQALGGVGAADRRLGRGTSVLGGVLATTIVLLAARARIGREGARAGRCYRWLPLVVGARRGPADTVLIRGQ